MESPGDTTRNQIDYIMINQRFRNCIKLGKIFTGADINSDHNPVKVKMKVKLKQMRKTKPREQIDLDLLKQQEYKDRYNIEVRNEYELLNTEETPQQPEPEFIENKRKSIKTCLTEALRTTLPKKTNRKKQKWMADDILNKMDERKAMKGRNEEHYQQLNKEISNDCRVAKENQLNEQCREGEDLERQF